MSAVSASARPVGETDVKVEGSTGASNVKVAVVPFSLDGGTDKTKANAFTWEVEAFKASGWQVVNQDLLNDAMKSLALERGTVLTEKNLLDIGKKVGADVVVGGSLKITSKKTTHLLGKKARTEMAVKPLGIDVAKGDVFYDPSKEGMSRNNNDAAAGVALLASFGGAFLINPSFSKEEEKAGKKLFIAIAEGVKTAYKP